MPQVFNPYFAGPPATDPETFFGRQDVLRFVDDTLASPKHKVIVFYGQRRIGKTSILHQIASHSGQDYQAVFFDLQGYIDDPTHELLYSLARTVTRQLDLPTPNRTDFQRSPDIFFTDFLPRIYDHLGHKRLLLLLDEFDALSSDTAPAELDMIPFVRVLNHIIQSDDKQVVFLFVVGRRLKDITSQQLRIFRAALYRQITLLKKEDCRQLIVQPARNILTYQDAAIEQIWSLTSGHPYFTQLICSLLFNQARHQKDWIVTEAQVEAVLDEAINAGEPALQWFWDEVPPIERFTLYAIGQLTTEQQDATLDQLIAQRNTLGVQVSDRELRALPDQLVDRQVLTRSSEGHYRFSVELVRRWVIYRHSLEEVTIELVQVAVDELAKALFETGRAAYRADDIDLAIETFSRALSINSNYVEARLWLARAHLKAGDLLAAINEFENVEHFPSPQQREARLGLADARAQYGQQLEKEGRSEEAIQEYQRTLKLDKQHPMANVRLSELLRQQADELLESKGLVAARPLFEQAFKHNPTADLKDKIKGRLAQYSQAQEKNHKREEARQAIQLSTTLMSKADDGQEALLGVQLERGRLYLAQHNIESAADIYRHILEEIDDASRQVIENDILRYSQQQEEDNHWERAEAALALLIYLFDNLENQNRLADNRCRQGKFYLELDDFTRAKAVYERALTIDSSYQAVINLVRDGFQSYRRNRQNDNSAHNRKSVEGAMFILVEILGRDDALAYQWLSEAQTELGQALEAEGDLAEAQSAFLRTLDSAIHLLQLASVPDQTYRFDEAAERIQQALADSRPDQQRAEQIKTIFNTYRQQQEERLHWNHARRAMTVLVSLFPADEEVKFWLAETQVSQANWHLQRAIPDLDEARYLVGRALDVALSAQKGEVIINKIKDSFRTRCRQQEEVSPPNWIQAEEIMNRLVGLLPGDENVYRWLADTRLKQGDWHLEQESRSLFDAHRHLEDAAEVYRRALRELPNDDGLIKHIKDSFKAYQHRQEQKEPPNWSLAKQAMQTMAELLPDDQEVQQWLTGIIERSTPQPQLPLWRRWSPYAAASIVILILGFILWYILIPPPPPSITFSTDQTTINYGDCASLQWDVRNAQAVRLNGEKVDVRGSQEVCPEETMTYVLLVDPFQGEIIEQPLTIEVLSTYPSAQPVAPENDAVFCGISTLPRLEWRSVGELGPDDFYVVHLNYVENGQSSAYTWQTKDTFWDVDTEVFYEIDPVEPEIEWVVVVAHVPGDDDNQDAIELSPPGQTRTFTWTPTCLPDGR